MKFSPQGEAVQVIAREKMVLPSTLEPDGGPGAGHADGSSEPGGDEPRRYLVIVVRDHGPGIAPEDQARIFERFEQVGNLLTAKPDGIGLGLAIAREIVRRHGGELRVRGGRECGSEFRIYLPVPAADARREDRTGALETAQ